MATLEESRLVQSMVTLPRNRHETQQQQDGGSDSAFPTLIPACILNYVATETQLHEYILIEWRGDTPSLLCVRNVCDI